MCIIFNKSKYKHREFSGVTHTEWNAEDIMQPHTHNKQQEKINRSNLGVQVDTFQPGKAISWGSIGG